MDISFKQRFSLLRREDREDIVRFGKAIESPIRLAILEQLSERQMTITELAKENRLSKSTVIFHLKILEEAGFIDMRQVPSKKGFALVAAYLFPPTAIIDEINSPSDNDLFLEQNMPIGAYSYARFDGSGRFGTEETARIAIQQNDVYNPVRFGAQMLGVMNGGRVEYTFSNAFARQYRVKELRISLEVCSEAVFFRNDWKSDFTFSVNGKEVAVWTSPGDFGGVRGKLNPPWWPANSSQYGILVTLSFDENGTCLNGLHAGPETLGTLGLDRGESLSFALEVKRDAEHYGGFNIFGAKLGNYPQDIVLTAICDPKKS